MFGGQARAPMDAQPVGIVVWATAGRTAPLLVRRDPLESARMPLDNPAAAVIIGPVPGERLPGQRLIMGVTLTC